MTVMRMMMMIRGECDDGAVDEYIVVMQGMMVMMLVMMMNIVMMVIMMEMMMKMVHMEMMMVTRLVE